MQRNSLHRGISDVTLVGRRIAKNYKILREVGGALKKKFKVTLLSPTKLQRSYETAYDCFNLQDQGGTLWKPL